MDTRIHKTPWASQAKSCSRLYRQGACRCKPSSILHPLPLCSTQNTSSQTPPRTHCSPPLILLCPKSKVHEYINRTTQILLLQWTQYLITNTPETRATRSSKEKNLAAIIDHLSVPSRQLLNSFGVSPFCKPYWSSVVVHVMSSRTLKFSFMHLIFQIRSDLYLKYYMILISLSNSISLLFPQTFPICNKKI